MGAVPQTEEIYQRWLSSGPRDVMAVHCSLAHSGVWRGLAHAFEPGALGLRGFDLLSHGKAPDWNGRDTLVQGNAARGLSLVREPVDLIGHSFGATVALTMAQTRPDLVRSLVLIEPVLFAAARDTDDESGPRALAHLQREDAPMAEAYQRGDVEEATRIFNRKWGGQGKTRPKWEDLPVAQRRLMMRAFPTVMGCGPELHEDSGGLLQGGRLAQLTMPLLLVEGGQSPAIIAAITAALRRKLPAARYARVENAGHMLPLTHAGPLAGEITRFWQAHCRTDVPG